MTPEPLLPDASATPGPEPVPSRAPDDQGKPKTSGKGVQASGRVPTPQAAPRRSRRYEVVETRTVVFGGRPVAFRQGKVLDSLGYDVEAVRACGVKLREVQE